MTQPTTRKYSPKATRVKTDIEEMGSTFTNVLKKREVYLDAAAAFVALHPEIIEIVRDGKKHMMYAPMAGEDY